MKSIYHLWKRRVSYLLKLYYKFATFQFDLIDLTYGLALFGTLVYLYIPHVREITKSLGEGPMFIVIQVATVAFMLMGRVKGYLKAADEVFLTPMNVAAKKFVDYSERLNLLLSLVGWGVVTTILYFIAPSLGLVKGTSFLYLWGMGILIKFIYNSINFILDQRSNGILGTFPPRLFKLLFWVGSYFFISHWFTEVISNRIMTVGILMGCTLALVIYYIRNKTVINWSKWITEETNRRARNFSILLKDFSREKRGNRKAIHKSLNGRRFLPFSRKWALLYLYFRLLLREQDNYLFIFQMILVMVVPIIATSETFYINTLHYIGIFLISNFTVSQWYQLMDSVWFRIYPFSLDEKNWAYNVGPITIVLPIILLLTLLNLLLSRWSINPLADLILLSSFALVVIYIKNAMQSFKQKV